LAIRAPIQPKLAVSQPNDPSEQEADRVADRVMRMAEPGAVSAAPEGLQRKCAGCEDEEKTSLQAKRMTSTTGEPSQAVGSAVPEAGRGGQPLPEAARAFFEPCFGRDFSSVRIHTDAEAARSAEAIDSLAFTYQQDVVFGPGQFDPHSEGGRRLLAHELAHVVQQAGGGLSSVQRQPKKGSVLEDWWPPDFKPICPECPIEPPSTKDAAEGICKFFPTNPICKFYHLEPPETSKVICPPGFHGSLSTTYKDQCCKDNQPESDANCCPKERVGDGRCCGPGEFSDQGACKKVPSVDITKLCAPPGQKAPSGECCFPPKVPGLWGCHEKKEEPAPKPLLFDTFVDRFTVLFNQDQPRVGQSFESSLAAGRGELDQAIDALKKDLSTGAQLVANASKEGAPDYNLDLTDRRLAAVRAEMQEVNWKVRDPMPPLGGDLSGCRGSWGAYSCGEKNADQKVMLASDRNVIIRLFRPTELKLNPQLPPLWPRTWGK
jgi:hypothetical protein